MSGGPSTRFWIGAAVIVVIGVALRLVVILVYRDLPIQSDGIHYSWQALLVADGKGFINPLKGTPIPDGRHPPGWTSILALVSAAGFRSTFDHQLTAVAVGAATVLVTALAGREAFGRRVGLIAAAIVSVYPGVWLYEHELFSEPLAMLCVSATIWVTYRLRNRPSVARAAVLGVVVGLSALSRSELLAINVLIVLPAMLGLPDHRLRRLELLAITGAATVLLIVPWTAYNSTRFAQPVLISTGLGSTMVVGNCPGAYDGERIGYFEFSCIFRVRDVDPDPSVSDGQHRAEALRFINDNRARFAKVATIRVLRTFSFYDPFGQVELEAARGSPTWMITAALASYWLLVPFAVLGGFVARRRRVAIYPLVGFVLITVLAVVPTIGAVRYRAVAEPAIAVLAAVGVDATIRLIHSSGRRRSARPDRRPAGDSLQVTSSEATLPATFS